MCQVCGGHLGNHDETPAGTRFPLPNVNIKTPSIVRYEYMRVAINMNEIFDAVKQINAIGYDGWEAFFIHKEKMEFDHTKSGKPYTIDLEYWYFRRPATLTVTVEHCGGS